MILPVRTRGILRSAPLRAVTGRLRRNGAAAAALGMGAFALVAFVVAVEEREGAIAIAAFAAVGVLWLALVILAIVRGHERADARAKTLGLRRTLAGHRVVEANLNRTERLLQAGSFHLDAATGSLTCSSEAERIVGGMRTARTGGTLDDLVARVHGDDREFVRRQIEGVLGGETSLDSDGTVLNFEFRIARPNGEIRKLHLRASCERDVRGHVHSLFGVVQDAAAGERAARGDEQLQAAFENAAIPTALVGLSGADRGLLVRVNKAFCARLGYPADDLVGETLADFGGPEYAGKIDDHLAELRTLGSGSSCFEIRCTRPNGELTPLRMHQACVTDADGEPRFAVIQLVDAGEGRPHGRRRRFDAHAVEIRSLQ